MSEVTMNKGAKSTVAQDYHRERSNRCGMTMSASVEGRAIADLMSTKPGVKVTSFPAIFRIDGENKIEFDMAEIAHHLGREEYSVYDFEVESSTHYGRQVRLDDRVLLFANPEDAADYLGWDIAPKGDVSILGGVVKVEE